MSGPLNLDPDSLAQEILAELTPEKTLPPALERVPLSLWRNGVRLAGLGKAAVEQVEVARQWFVDRGIPIEGVVAVTKHGHGTGDWPFRVVHASHPICDGTSRSAAAELLRFAEETPGRAAGGAAFVLCLSGGGSALAAEPRPPFTFEQKTAAFRQLVDGGASIEETNLIRREMSAFKNGGLRLACGERPVVTLITSDVPTDPEDLQRADHRGLAVVASGPTIHHEPDPARVREAATHWLEATLAGQIIDSLGSPERAHWHTRLSAARDRRDRVEVAADWIRLLDAATTALGARGLKVTRLSEPCDAGIERGVEDHLQSLASWRSARRTGVLISAGEYPSAVRGEGKGGRNTEFVVRMAQALFMENRLGFDDGLLDRITVLSLATDGGDGPTDAAGGWLTRATLQRGLDGGADLERALANSDTLTFLDACETAFRTGPTATNLMDLHVLAIC